MTDTVSVCILIPIFKTRDRIVINALPIAQSCLKIHKLISIHDRVAESALRQKNMNFWRHKISGHAVEIRPIKKLKPSTSITQVNSNYLGNAEACKSQSRQQIPLKFCNRVVSTPHKDREKSPQHRNCSRHGLLHKRLELFSMREKSLADRILELVPQTWWPGRVQHPVLSPQSWPIVFQYVDGGFIRHYSGLVGRRGHGCLKSLGELGELCLSSQVTTINISSRVAAGRFYAKYCRGHFRRSKTFQFRETRFAESLQRATKLVSHLSINTRISGDYL